MSEDDQTCQGHFLLTRNYCRSGTSVRLVIELFFWKASASGEIVFVLQSLITVAKLDERLDLQLDANFPLVSSQCFYIYAFKFTLKSASNHSKATTYSLMSY